MHITRVINCKMSLLVWKRCLGAGKFSPLSLFRVPFISWKSWELSSQIRISGMKIIPWVIESRLQVCVGYKRGYNMYRDIIFGLVAWICLSISDFFAEYLDFFTMDCKIEKSHGGAPPEPRGSAPASLRPPLRCSGPAAHPCWFFNFTINREKVKISIKKSEISGKSLYNS